MEKFVGDSSSPLREAAFRVNETRTNCAEAIKPAKPDPGRGVESRNRSTTARRGTERGTGDIIGTSTFLHDLRDDLALRRLVLVMRLTQRHAWGAVGAFSRKHRSKYR